MVTGWMRGFTTVGRSRRVRAAIGSAALVVAFVPAAAGGVDRASAAAGTAQSWLVAGQSVANTATRLLSRSSPRPMSVS